MVGATSTIAPNPPRRMRGRPQVGGVDAGCVQRDHAERHRPGGVRGRDHHHRVAREIHVVEELSDERVGGAQRTGRQRAALRRRGVLPVEIGAGEIGGLDEHHGSVLPHAVERAHHLVPVEPHAVGEASVGDEEAVIDPAGGHGPVAAHERGRRVPLDLSLGQRIRARRVGVADDGPAHARGAERITQRADVRVEELGPVRALQRGETEVHDAARPVEAGAAGELLLRGAAAVGLRRVVGAVGGRRRRRGACPGTDRRVAAAYRRRSVGGTRGEVGDRRNGEEHARGWAARGRARPATSARAR